MVEGKGIFKIEVLDNGEFRLTDMDNKYLTALSSEQLGRSLYEKKIVEAKILSLPSITYLKSNPEWVCVLGSWYYI